MKSVLIRLLNNRNYISGEELAQSLDLSRTAVWKQVNKLKESGFVIESVHKTGYRLTGVPDEKIVPELVEYYYGGQLPLELIEIEQVDSTNTFAKKTLLDKNCLQLVIAEEQTCGKGRLSRVWESSKGKDLTFSIVCPSERNINDFYKYTVIAAVSVYYAIVPLIKENNADMKIKWPNDIYINQKKVCGILSEMITEEMKIKNMIVGIGVNVNSNPYMEKAVSIKQISNSAENRNKLLAEIIRNFNKYME
jgi:BirA family biotin operon repressor/biotin-[acetyl-CoA-carboxylase] ligase